MIDNAFGLIVTGERTTRLKDLTLSRSTAAVPFGGRYRAIDFILSNLVNAGITSVSGARWTLSAPSSGTCAGPPTIT